MLEKVRLVWLLELNNFVGNLIEYLIRSLEGLGFNLVWLIFILLYKCIDEIGDFFFIMLVFLILYRILVGFLKFCV